VIGTFDASDINYAANYLAGLVKANNLPPKILIIHRFTYPNGDKLQRDCALPEVQIVMDMDGWARRLVKKKPMKKPFTASQCSLRVLSCFTK